MKFGYKSNALVLYGIDISSKTMQHSNSLPQNKFIVKFGYRGEYHINYFCTYNVYHNKYQL